MESIKKLCNFMNEHPEMKRGFTKAAMINMAVETRKIRKEFLKDKRTRAFVMEERSKEA